MTFAIWYNALGFAASRHGSQSRKGSAAPYLVHPIGVSENAFLFYPDNRSLAIAGLLHDLIEDTETTAEEIRDAYGDEVARLVVGVTSERGKNWAETRSKVLAKLESAELDVVRLKACDALNNATAIVRDVRIHGDDFWAPFKATQEQIRGYYQGISEVVGERLGDEPIGRELEYVVGQI